MKRVAVILLPFLLFTSVAFAFTKPKALSNAEEVKWLREVKTHKTKDGSTVSEVLAHAQKMRPGKFKSGSFVVGYNGATGLPDAVAIEYWLGTRRAPDDAYVDLGYEMTRQGKVVPPTNASTFAAALESGKTDFLMEVDKAYNQACKPDPRLPPDC